jgi:hypothetical protein
MAFAAPTVTKTCSCSMILCEVFCSESYPDQKSAYKIRQNLIYAQEQSKPFTAWYSQVSKMLNGVTWRATIPNLTLSEEI